MPLFRGVRYALLSPPITPPAAAADLLAGLVAHWTLDEVSGTRADSHGSSDLTDASLTTGSFTGKIGSAASFNGSADALVCADNASLSMGDIDFTIACWLQITTKGADGAAIWKGTDSSSTVEYAIHYLSGLDWLAFRVGSGITSGDIAASALGSPSTSTWYLVIGWHDAAANTISIQVNNGTVNSTTYTFGSYDSALGFALGRAGDSSSRYWNGLIDSVSIWKRILTADERTSLYNSGSGLDYGSF